MNRILGNGVFIKSLALNALESTTAVAAPEGPAELHYCIYIPTIIIKIPSEDPVGWSIYRDAPPFLPLTSVLYSQDY
jgi:hypothetical protein